MAEGLLEWDMNRTEPARSGNHDRWMSPHETYKALGDDDKWVSIAVGTEEEWRALCRGDGAAALADDARFRTAELRKQNEAALDENITRVDDARAIAGRSPRPCSGRAWPRFRR